MGAIPTQRETTSRARGAPERARADATLTGSPLAPGSARAVVRAALAEWTERALPGAEHLTARAGDDAALVASELVTNAVVHAGTDVRLTCRLEDGTGALVVEVTDRHPSRPPRDHEPEAAPHLVPEFGRGLGLVAALCEVWGVTYRPGEKTVWARLPPGGRPEAEGVAAYAAERTPAHDRDHARAPAREAPGTSGGPAEDATPAPPDAPDAPNAPGERQPQPGDERQPQLGDVRAGEDAWDGEDARADGDAWACRNARAGGDAWHGSGAGAGTPAAAGSPAGVGPRSGGPAEDATSAGTGSGPHGTPAVGRSPAPRSPHQTPPATTPGTPGAPADNPPARRSCAEGAWLGRGALSFLAEASDLLAGQLDEDLVTALTGQLIVPRLADWCAVWLADEATPHGGWGGGRAAHAGGPARVWHAGEHLIEELHAALDRDPPQLPDPLRPGPTPYPWPAKALDTDAVPSAAPSAAPFPGPSADQPADAGSSGTALAYPLVAGGWSVGTLVIGRAGVDRFPDEVTGLVEDLGRRVALAIGAARQYARQATISSVLQRGLLPGAVAEIPGLRSALVHEPCDKGGPSGDFYDLFPAGRGRWCFAVGDVQGKGPEAAVVIGLVRPWLRLLAREGYRVADVLDRLNQLLLDDATEAADAAARALVAAGARPTAPGDGPQTRFLSLLYGELVPVDGGVRCTVASAGHPLPLLLAPDGIVRTVARPQTLLGVVEDAAYGSDSFELRSGDTLLCVTDGVTERRSGSRQLDDGDGLAVALASCAGLDAGTTAERLTRLVHDFGDSPPADDLALMVLQAE
ncbi:ATP-binding SpoIIE family protein phosphatase [Streptomyces sp. NPDC029526]|uniref:ATP-binding SpoIIE family protein phosphatase n=1 Tax=Streptomyces sp. NPDC029526 TaxID=3155728 RepID=UPI0033FC1EF2